MTLEQLLNDTCVLLKSPLKEVRIESRVVQVVLKKESCLDHHPSIQELASRIQTESEIDVTVLPSGGFLLKKRKLSRC
jgi:hypothetical protein